MNIVVFSKCSNNVDAGLNWSVPARIKALGKIDSIIWIDLNPNAFQSHWGEVKAYHNISDFSDKFTINLLPYPFNEPDFVIFEGFYYLDHVRLSKDLNKNGIPYIIVPRSAFTTNAFKNGCFFKYLKKKIAHLLIFNKYIKNAIAIQYLTEREKIESSKFKCNAIISPNGISLPIRFKETFSNGIKAVYIGRQDINQKGLDLLLNAIRNIHDELEEIGFKLVIFGPPRYDYKQVSNLIDDFGINDIVENKETGISGKEKEKVLLDSDLFILTSRFEGMPMGLIEALSYGLPVLVTEGTNMAEEILTHDAGWGCDTSVESIQETLQEIVKNKNKFVEKGINARNLASKYNWDKIALRFHNKMVEIIKKQKYL